ncbi:MAG TPA: TetR/AcrR family transcriptional regulator [Aeromonadales bacterium]|nr:TetR/AcrR family transcriptional regulator [Aeromonadales bacterium]
MDKLNVKFNISEQTYLRDPDSTELGRKIIFHGIQLIDELGFENFTFKKLGACIGSPESSVYRYFENKHMFLVYLYCWYWSWIEYKLLFSIINIGSSEEQLRKAIHYLTAVIEEDHNFSHVDEVKLDRIVMNEGSKTYHIKEIDQENKKGYFQVYKRVVQRVSEIILTINPDFEFSHMLVSTIIEGSRQQRFFSQHLPSLTDVDKDKDSISEFYEQMAFRVIKTETKN